MDKKCIFSNRPIIKEKTKIPYITKTDALRARTVLYNTGDLFLLSFVKNYKTNNDRYIAQEL